MEPDPVDPWLRPGDVARLLGVTRKTARKLVIAEGLPHRIVGPSRELRVQQSVVTAYLDRIAR